MNEGVNVFVVLASVIAVMVIGIIWYSNTLFGKQWTKLVGLPAEALKDMRKQSLKYYGTSFLAVFLMAFALAKLHDYTQIPSVYYGVRVAFWAWLGFVATTMYTTHLFTKKPWKLYFIDAGYQLVSLLSIGYIVARWS